MLISLNVHHEVHAAILRSADREGISVSRWIELACLDAIRRPRKATITPPGPVGVWDPQPKEVRG